MSCRRCAFSRARTPFFTARSSSRPAIRMSSAIGVCSLGWVSTPATMKRDAQALERGLAELDRGLLRRRRATLATHAAASEWPAVSVDGRRAVDFCSNDYLGLARHPDIAAAM